MKKKKRNRLTVWNGLDWIHLDSNQIIWRNGIEEVRLFMKVHILVNFSQIIHISDVWQARLMYSSNYGILTMVMDATKQKGQYIQ